MDYNFELDKVIATIKKNKAKTVCVQLPDGLKPKAEAIVSSIEANTDANVFLWLGSCYGACDTPDIKDVDLLVQFGHTRWV